MKKTDYSMYVYFKGDRKYPNKKAEFFGFYEQSFENTYTGGDAEKAEKFKDYILLLLYEQVSDAYHFGEAGVDKDKIYEDYIRIYHEPEYKSELYDRTIA